MNHVSALNNRLESASKKFTKACEQIKLLKQQLAVYIAMLSSYNSDAHSSNSTTTNTHLISRSEQKELDKTPNFSVNVSKDMIRQKIETLQDFKNIVFVYAHQKADEITKLQCELYGEEAVRDAYDNSPSSSQEYAPESDDQVESEVISTDSNDSEETDSSWGNGSWGNYEQEQSFVSESHVNRPSQLQLVEYDFLTA